MDMTRLHCGCSIGLYSQVVSGAGCSSASDMLACLHGMDVATLIGVEGSISSANFLGVFTFVPVNDGTFITDRPSVILSANVYVLQPALTHQQHGVGNWKAVLKDPELTFDGRSAVDLKDRFRTYYPDAYKQHYPNAKTHLSSKVRSTLPDGSSIFEKTRSKKRRPFTEEEDRTLKAGYEKHGTVWSTIVRDPVFREQNRRSTDLRDRFRNAFPELYQAAGYKPRNAVKKKCRATDDGLVGTSSGSVGPARSRKRALTSESLFRGGVKSVPQSVTNSDDEASGEEDEEDTKPLSRSFLPPPVRTEFEASPPEPSASTSSEALGEFDMQPLDDPLSEFMQGSSQPVDPWSAPSNASAWTAASPASSRHTCLPPIISSRRARSLWTAIRRRSGRVPGLRRTG